MNIAIIASGGDGPGMNNCLYEMVKGLKGHNVTLFEYGYQGLIDDKVTAFSPAELNKVKNRGGTIIKSSRSAEFMTPKGKQKAINTLKKHNIDVLIIMGGNGSLCGAKELIKNGIKIIFIPTTIDNDIKESDYCLGFDTAIHQATNFVLDVDFSMQSFDRICIYEVMGRHCPDLALRVGKNTKACYVFTDKSTKQQMLKAVKHAIKMGEFTPKIILQENTVDIGELKAYLIENLKNRDIKSAIIGYYQRGGLATAKEIENSKSFAVEVIKCVKNKQFNTMVVKNKNTFKSIAIN